MLDLKAIYASVNIRRQQLELSWEEVAAQIGVPVDDLRSLGTDDANPPVSVPFSAVKWCGLEIDGYLVEELPSDLDPERREKIASFLRADRELKPEDAAAIEEILHAAHERFTSA